MELVRPGRCAGCDLLSYTSTTPQTLECHSLHNRRHISMVFGVCGWAAQRHMSRTVSIVRGLVTSQQTS